ncbi:DDE-type integrase/transposase/recombinase [Sphaerochaeta pleomorpha]|uniref:DDE-type integrase/transposase/recombinase n=1 Tax=Sphaerochaeta pleomorpha TaxID=1131707 RepID=UPI002478573A|nr:DDE-type integrase/transposase/recombinase [Sphaerochaeta pleomorpha]
MSEQEKAEILAFVDEAMLLGVSQRKTCEFLGIAARTIQNWRHEGLCDKRKGSSRRVAHSLTQNEQDAFFSLATSPRFRDNTPEQIVATLAQEGTYIASVSSLYRILRKRDALRHRQESRKPAKAQVMERLSVTGPNQIWAWDITWLKTEVRGIFLYAYTIIDVYDRSIIGWTIEDHESDILSQRLFSRVTRDLRVVPAVIHGDFNDKLVLPRPVSNLSVA